MSNQPITDLAAAIGAVQQVSDRGITPSAVWVPDIGRRSDIDAPMIQVAPVRRETRLISRRESQTTYTIQAAIVEPLGDNPNSTAETADAMAEAITNTILGSIIAGGTNLRCTGVEEIVSPDSTQWREKRLYISVLAFTLTR